VFKKGVVSSESTNHPVYYPRYLTHLTPNGHFMGRTSQLTSRCCILYIYSTNIRIEYFKYAT